MAAEQLDALTPREREILALIAEGESLPEIAQRLHRSLKTIESHRLSLGRKLKASNRVELARIAIAAGLVKIDSNTGGLSQDSQDTSDWAETELAWLKQINDAVHPAVSGTFLQRFCNAASQLPGIDFAAICTPDPEQDEVIDPYCRCVMAFAEHGEPGERIRYHAKDTPCERIIREGECVTGEGIRSAFPDDTILEQLSAESYIGFSLLNSSGQAVGGVGIIGQHPIQDISAYRRVLTFFAPRVTAELEQLKQIQAMQREQEAMRGQIRMYQNALSEQGSEVELSSASKLVQLESRVDHFAGVRFLRVYVDNLCDVYGVRCAGICTHEEHDGKPMFYAFIHSEHAQQVDSLRYPPRNSPCEVVWNTGSQCVIRDVATKYPEDKGLIDIGGQAYIGIRLDTPSGDRLGVMWVIDTKPIDNPAPIQLALDHYKRRVAAEVEQYSKFNKILAEHERSMAEIDSTSIN